MRPTRDTMPPAIGAVDYEYRIGKYEVTAGQYTEFLNAVAATDTYRLYNGNIWDRDDGCKIQRTGSPGSYTYSVAADRANRPVNYVGWGDAVRFVNWLHNGQPTGAQGLDTTEDGAYYLNGATTITGFFTVTRKAGAKCWLPSENEWYKAAYHKNDGVTGNYFDYPTSSDSEPSNQLIDPDPGNNANFRVGPPESGDYTIGSPYWMTEVGAFANSDSPYGTFDQGGNIFEWNDTENYRGFRGLRGEAWTGVSRVMAASWLYAFQDPELEYRDLGFRVASVPAPYVASVDVNGGGAWRSMVTSLVVTFSQLVTIDAGAFEVMQRGTGTAVDVAFTTAEVNGKTIATLTFSGELTEYGSLVDGNYQLTVLGDSVHDPLSGLTLDGDEDGAAGGDYVFGDALVDNFFRLFGDLDGSRFVGNNDYAVFRLAFRTEFGDDGYDSQLDSDGSGFIGNNDYALFRLHFRIGLPFE